MHILLLQDQPDIRARFVFALECSLDATVSEASSAEEAIKIIRTKEKPVDVIIYDYAGVPLKKFNQVAAISTYLPWIFVVGDPKARPTITGVERVFAVDRSDLVEGVFSAIKAAKGPSHLKEDQPEGVGGIPSDFVRIQTDLLLNVAPLMGDIYIRLSPSHFVKLFRQGDIFDRADLEKYTTQKGVTHLYISQAQTQEFVQKVIEDLRRLLSKANLTVGEASRSNVAVHESVQELAKRVGFTPEVQELAKCQVELAVQSASKNPRLADLLESLRRSDGNYISTHSTLTGYLACGIASQMQWGSEATFYKLNLAAFLHDIMLSSDELAQLETIDQLEGAGARFTETEREEFRSHPAKGAEIAKRFHEVPPDVDTILLQHHELPDGKGFPRYLNHTYIAPLAAVFIVAHDLAVFTIKAGKDYRLGDFLEARRATYKATQFKKILQALETVTEL